MGERAGLTQGRPCKAAAVYCVVMGLFLRGVTIGGRACRADTGQTL